MCWIVQLAPSLERTKRSFTGAFLLFVCLFFTFSCFFLFLLCLRPHNYNLKQNNNMRTRRFYTTKLENESCSKEVLKQEIADYFKKKKPQLKCLKWGIYCITNTENGNQYIGSSTDIGKRYGQHLKDLESGLHHSYKFQNDFFKFHKGVFRLSIIWKPKKECTVEELRKMEMTYINSMKPHYNIILE